jgi:hypothetical protein
VKYRVFNISQFIFKTHIEGKNGSSASSLQDIHALGFQEQKWKNKKETYHGTRLFDGK